MTLAPAPIGENWSPDRSQKFGIKLKSRDPPDMANLNEQSLAHESTHGTDLCLWIHVAGYLIIDMIC